MKQRFELSYLFILLLLLSACTRSPAAEPVPSLPAPTLLPATPAPTLDLGPWPCPVHYVSRVDTRVGFSACYPVGWTFTEHEDVENQVKRIDFIAPPPTEGTRQELKFIAVGVAPRITESSDEALLQTVAKWLTEEYPQGLVTSAVSVDGRKAIEVKHEGPVVLGREVLRITRWITVFVAEDQQWEIEMTGRSEERQELEQLHEQFLAHFCLLTR